MSLGEILVKRGILSRAKLEAALAAEQAQGIGLANYLVEEGILTGDQLALVLAQQFGVPPALEADFVRADASLRKRLVVHQAIELQAIPLFLTSPRRVAVAMANPTNPRALDRLAFILGATVDPMVASEVALARQFELLYRVKRKRGLHPALKDLPVPQQVAKEGAVVGPPESSELSESSQIRPALRSHHRAVEDKQPVPRMVGDRASLGADHDDEVSHHLRLAPLHPGNPEPGAPIAVMEDALCFTPTPLTFIPPRPCDPPKPSRVLSRHPLTPIVVPITSASAQLAVEQIRFAADQQDLSDNLFTFMRACFAVGAMFVVAGAVAQPRFGFSGGQVRPQVERLRFSLSLPSCLRIARSRRATFRGAPPPDGMAVQRPLWSALGTDPPNDVLVSPVIVDGLVTMLLYAQAEPGGRINGLAASKIEQVCEALSCSLLRLAV